MAPRERRGKLERLAKLTGAQVEVMYYRCLDKDVSEITDILKKENEGTIWSRFTRIFRILEITGEEELVTEYCPIFQEFIKTEDDWKNWANIRSEILRHAWELPSTSEPEPSPESTTVPTSESPGSEVTAAQNEPEPSPTTSQTTPESETQSQSNAESASTTSSSQTSESQQSGTLDQVERVRNRFPWPIIAILVLILCVLCIAAVPFIWGIIGRFENGIMLTQAAQTPTLPMPTATITPQTTDTPIATFTNAPSQTPTPTTSTLTPTSIPTETLSPNTFFDDFADGLDPEWTKVFGNPVVANEQLTAGELTLLSLGDSTWTDYQIEFDVAHISRHIAPGNNNNAIGVRATDMDNMVAFVFVVFDSSWYYLVDGKWNPVPNAIACCVDDPAHVTIRVEDNKFTADNRKDFRVSFIDNDHPSGNIFVWIFPDSIYDNFKVTLLNP